MSQVGFVINLFMLPKKYQNIHRRFKVTRSRAGLGLATREPIDLFGNPRIPGIMDK
jgi:hypothetical protein